MSEISATTINQNAATGNPSTSEGTAGLNTQVGGQPTTVSAAQAAQQSVTDGKQLIQPDIDEDLFKFSSDDTPLMNLMLKAKKVTVTSPEVDHYMIDEPTAIIKTSAASAAGVIKFSAADAAKVHAYDTLCVKGKKNSEGRPVQLFVTAVNETNGEVSVICDNFNKTAGQEYGALAANDIAAGVEVVILGNALYETQKEVDPDLVLPLPETVYLQKRGMNNVVSDYFDSQKKRIPFNQATIAEASIRNFKVKGNRTLWIGQKSKCRVKGDNKTGLQYVYKTEGVRWQFKRELEHTGKWTYENFIALAKMFYTGEDVPSNALGLCGKNFLERIQCIDWTGHNEIKIDQKTTRLGWSVMNIHTAFGDLQFKHEPTLDRIGYSNSCALLGEDRLVHYQRKAESSFNDRVEGEEAKRTGILVWDALCLKGSCHIWIDGEGTGEKAPKATEFKFWAGTAMPTATEAVNNVVYVLEKDIDSTHIAMSAWKASVSGSTVTFTQYTDVVYPA